MEINTLLCGVSEHRDTVHSVMPDTTGALWLTDVDDCCTDERQRDMAPPPMICRVLRGSDICDLPTEYTVEDLLLHEHPVIGTYMEKAIVPGFRYQVRCLGSQKYLFGARPLALRSIGMGYARRITFEGPIFDNMNYFYSDSHEKGYGFSLVALHMGECFVITGDDERPLGTASVNYVKAQRELASRSLSCGAIEKRVQVVFTCTVRHCGLRHGILPLYADNTVDVSGVAILVRPRRASKVTSVRVEQIDIPHIGDCTLTRVDKPIW